MCLKEASGCVLLRQGSTALKPEIETVSVVAGETETVDPTVSTSCFFGDIFM